MTQTLGSITTTEEEEGEGKKGEEQERGRKRKRRGEAAGFRCSFSLTEQDDWR